MGHVGCMNETVAAISTAGDVIQDAGVFKAKGTGHEVSIPRGFVPSGFGPDIVLAVTSDRLIMRNKMCRGISYSVQA
jgi:hypothetical protein